MNRKSMLVKALSGLAVIPFAGKLFASKEKLEIEKVIPMPYWKIMVRIREEEGILEVGNGFEDDKGLLYEGMSCKNSGIRQILIDKLGKEDQHTLEKFAIDYSFDYRNLEKYKVKIYTKKFKSIQELIDFINSVKG